MMGQPSSPGIWVSELRFGGVKLNAGEATLCIDMAGAPWLFLARSWTRTNELENSAFAAALQRPPAGSGRPAPLQWSRQSRAPLAPLSLALLLRRFLLQVRRVRRGDRDAAGPGLGERSGGLLVAHDLGHHGFAGPLEHGPVLDHEFLRLAHAVDIAIDLRDHVAGHKIPAPTRCLDVRPVMHEADDGADAAGRFHHVLDQLHEVIR